MAGLPRNLLVLVQGGWQGGKSEKSVIYDPTTKKVTGFPGLAHESALTHNLPCTADGQGVLVCGNRGEVFLQKMGKPWRLLFRWRNRVMAAAQSPDGKRLAIYDGDAVWLVDANSKEPRKLDVSASYRTNSIVDFRFNIAGGKLAGLCSHSTRGPGCLQ